jgi:hypothetical protein
MTDKSEYLKRYEEAKQWYPTDDCPTCRCQRHLYAVGPPTVPCGRHALWCPLHYRKHPERAEKFRRAKKLG